MDCLGLPDRSAHKAGKTEDHQANEKMDEAIVKRLYRLFGKKEIPENIMPMIIGRKIIEIYMHFGQDWLTRISQTIRNEAPGFCVMVPFFV